MLKESGTGERFGLLCQFIGRMNPFFPGSGRDFGILHKFPVHFSITSHLKEVTDGGTYIDTCILIAVGSRLFALK